MFPSAHLGQLLSPLCPRHRREKTTIMQRSLTWNFRGFVKHKASQQQTVIISTQQAGKPQHRPVKSDPATPLPTTRSRTSPSGGLCYSRGASKTFAWQLPTHLASCPSPCVEAGAPTFPAHCPPLHRCHSRVGAAELPFPTSSASPAWLACASWSYHTSAASRGRDATARSIRQPVHSQPSLPQRHAELYSRARTRPSCRTEYRLWQLQIPTGSAVAWSDPLASQIKQEHYVLVPPTEAPWYYHRGLLPSDHSHTV